MWEGDWESVQTWRNLHLVQMFGNATPGMPRSSMMLGKLAIGEILQAGQELDNAVDKFVLRVVQNNKTVGHLPCEYSRILWISHVVQKLLQTPVRRNGDS